MSDIDLIVWDLDDTLIDNVHDYSQPILDTLSVIVRELGHKAPHVTALMEIEHGIDSARVQEVNPETGEKFLFSMERFPGSQVETYRFICSEVGVEPDPAVEQELWDIGMQAFDASRYLGNIRPEADEVLAHVAGTDATQVLLTKGDQRVQERKLHALAQTNLLEHFAETVIVPTKGAAEFSHTALSLEKRTGTAFRCTSIGNSYRSDIAPALEAGFTGILVPVWNWEEIHKKDELYAQADADERVFIAEDLTGVPAVLAEIVR